MLEDFCEKIEKIEYKNNLKKLKKYLIKWKKIIKSEINKEKCGENQELLCEENKIMTDEMINDLSGLNEFEQELKGQVEFLNQKIISNKDNHENIQN